MKINGLTYVKMRYADLTGYKDLARYADLAGNADSTKHFKLKNTNFHTVCNRYKNIKFITKNYNRHR